MYKLCVIVTLFHNFCSGGLVLKDTEVKGIIKEGNTDMYGQVSLEITPPSPGLAEIQLSFQNQNLQVRPSTAFIRPLSLDYSRRCSTGSNGSTKSMIAI